MAMIRRFVNIVAENCRSGVYSVHRLDVSKHLFYPSTIQAHANATVGTIERLQELPSPCIRIQPATIAGADRPKRDFFGLVSTNTSTSEGRILYINRAGHSVLYDIDSGTRFIIHSLSGDKGRQPIFVSVPSPDAKNSCEDLYMMARSPHHVAGWGSCFDVLRSGPMSTWGEWQALPPPPPFVDSLGYDTDNPAIICSHTVVDGGRTICVSFAKGFGTYCFDTVECAWRQVGDWVLPFEGGAEYAPDLNLLLGLSPESPHHLCWTPELSTMVMDQPPEQQTWEDLVTPENWSPTTVRLINLGSGRFCIAKLFAVKRGTYDLDYYDPLDVECEIAIFIGVEIGNGAQGPIVLKHKSIQYQITDDVIPWVL